MSVIWKGPTKYFTVEILRGSTKYPGALPALSGKASLVRDHFRFVAKKRADYLRRYNRSLTDVTETATKFVTDANSYTAVVEPLLTDYDKEEVLPSTCALGLWNSACTDLDAQGYLGQDSDVEYPNDVFKAIVDFYSKYTPKSASELSLAMTRGKTIGYPYMVGGMNRSLNAVFMALSAAWVVGIRKKNSSDSLADLYNLMRSYHGDPFAIEGSRQQHTTKEMPMVLTDGIFSSTNFNPRYRIINMDPKVSVMVIRADIKRMLEGIKKSPVHTQNRDEITKRISDAVAKGWTVYAVDHSKFDFRHGGKRGLQQIAIHGAILKSKDYVNSATLAFKTRFFTYGHRQVLQFPGDSLLKSGMGNTTIIGCTGNLSSFVAALSKELRISPASVLQKMGTEWDALMWGDDCVAMFKDPTWKDKLSKGLKYYKLEVEEEPTVKYLGVNYSQGKFEGNFDKGYSVGRAFQNLFFPERTKDYPFTTIGYIARLDLMGAKGSEFHTRVLPYFEQLKLGDPFAFADRHARLEAMIPDMERQAAKISQMDDVLNIFTHGIQDMDPNLVEIPDEYMKILGLTTLVDLSDPKAFLSQENADNPTEKIPDQILAGVGDLMKGDFSRYSLLVSELVNFYKLTWAQGSVLY